MTALLVLALPTAAQAMPASGSGGAQAAVTKPAQCVVHNLESFIDQGLEKEASSVADIVEVECNPFEYDETVTISDQQLFDRCGKHMSWSPTFEFKPTEGPATEATLDDDGGATVVLWAGPGCKPGETTILVDEKKFPFETFEAKFTVLPPVSTPEGVTALPANLVEDDVYSSVATIIQVEFPVVETKVAINAEQLFTRCGKAPHVIWVGPNEKVITENEGRLEGAHALETDDNGNAFVVALGDRSCQPGKVTVEASLEEAESYDSVFTTFEIEAPRVTFEETEGKHGPPPPTEGFSVVKEQRFQGETTYTKKKLIGKVGQTVEYQITVTNNGEKELKLEKITDTACEEPIVGPSKSELAHGESATYTCKRKLTAPGVFTNVATIEANKEKEKSNEVEVEVPTEPPPEVEPNFTIEKEQKLSTESESHFTKKELDAKLNQVVDYRIRVTNTGPVSLKFSPLTDAHCTNIAPTTEIELKPGASAIYTCEHKLVATGHWINEATITGTNKEGKSKTKTSNEVIVDPPCSVREASIAVRGVAALESKPFTASVSARGIKRITFYLDGRRIETLTAARAVRGAFVLRISPNALRAGRHRISASVAIRGGGCAAFVRSRTFTS